MNSRTKGKQGELEFAHLLHDHLGVKITRNLEQSRNGGHDLRVHEGEQSPAATALRRFAMEVKRYGTVTPGDIASWWGQAVRQAQQVGALPLLAYRANRADWSVMIPLGALVADCTDNRELAYAVTLKIEAFALLIRECE
ncbi:MAG: hypothetical protein KDI44_12855 [Thiothrix sp.]|nr:hypothetical protein [Thiothrix sp.]HPQ97605.1 hypothetical protein [Thiolinea sp.]